MSALTKVFVVFVTVLSLVLVAFTVSFIADSEELRGELDQVARELRESQSREQAKDRRIDDMLEAREQLQSDHATARQQWRSQQEQLRDQLTQATSERRQAQSDLQTWQSSLERLSVNDGVRANLLTTMQGELQDRREDEIRHRRQIVELTETVTTRQAEADRLGRQVRRLREQMVALQEQSQQLENQLASVPSSFWGGQDADGLTRVAHPRPESPIFGQVTRIRGNGSQRLVQINVGSVDGVEEGMQFVIHRNNDYRGRLVINTVDEDASVGTLQIEQETVEEGDRIVAVSAGDL